MEKTEGLTNDVATPATPPQRDPKKILKEYLGLTKIGQYSPRDAAEKMGLLNQRELVRKALGPLGEADIFGDEVIDEIHLSVGKLGIRISPEHIGQLNLDSVFTHRSHVCVTAKDNSIVITIDN